MHQRTTFCLAFKLMDQHGRLRYVMFDTTSPVCPLIQYDLTCLSFMTWFVLFVLFLGKIKSPESWLHIIPFCPTGCRNCVCQPEYQSHYELRPCFLGSFGMCYHPASPADAIYYWCMAVCNQSFSKAPHRGWWRVTCRFVSCRMNYGRRGEPPHLFVSFILLFVFFLFKWQFWFLLICDSLY